jgi:hypothetical protein
VRPEVDCAGRRAIKTSLCGGTRAGGRSLDDPLIGKVLVIKVAYVNFTFNVLGRLVAAPNSCLK